jgi:hypothetical protein
MAPLLIVALLCAFFAAGVFTGVMLSTAFEASPRAAGIEVDDGSGKILKLFHDGTWDVQPKSTKSK